ncbi:hypothetical protein C8R46DRAFT_1196202 [Mycena filopes]|nr:hypothetical protein C8R46DRAFT_1196202 [Mycena filopes]
MVERNESKRSEKPTHGQTEINKKLYLVARSMGRSEWIHTSEIGRVVAKLMWFIRGVVLYEMEKVMGEEKLLSYQAYERFKKYLVSGQDTVMSYLYGMSALIKSIRGSEYTDAHSWISDERGRELAFNDEIIQLDKFAELHFGLQAEYDEILKNDIFFGEEIPAWFTRDIDMRSLVDDPRNNSAGYSFLDHPRNGFTPMFSLYGEWLLSDPARAAQFCDLIDGQIVWKSAPVYQLLRSFSRLRYLLCTKKIVDVGP